MTHKDPLSSPLRKLTLAADLKTLEDADAALVATGDILPRPALLATTPTNLWIKGAA